MSPLRILAAVCCALLIAGCGWTDEQGREFKVRGIVRGLAPDRLTRHFGELQQAIKTASGTPFGETRLLSISFDPEFDSRVC